MRLTLSLRRLALPLGRSRRSALPRCRLATALHLPGSLLPLPALAGLLRRLPLRHALPALLTLAARHAALARDLLTTGRRGTLFGGRHTLAHSALWVSMLRGLPVCRTGGKQ